ncbi:hypothetical protein ACJMK2_004150 [Sinanodonta woodiana]|uniref:Uncharacterized protein n=1 Tax=Sinanodonta woodiana TaxID=1069815 RepID=A0ABD3Y325_SINWO
MEGAINYVALACSTLSLILDIVAVAIPNWISKSPKYLHFAAYIKATGALLIIGLIMMTVAIVVVLLKMFVMKDNSCLLILVGAIVFAAKVIHEIGITADTLSAGFALAIVSSGIAIIAGILLFLGNNK